MVAPVAPAARYPATRVKALGAIREDSLQVHHPVTISQGNKQRVTMLPKLHWRHLLCLEIGVHGVSRLCPFPELADLLCRGAL